MREWQTIWVSGIVAISVNCASAADLNSPVERHITIKSEIKRGESAGLDCFLLGGPGSSWLDYSRCVSDILSKETQANTITDPFRLGLYGDAYRNLEIFWRSTMKEGNKDLRKDFVMGSCFCYP
jgi:hypothetical protein